jgi:predicted GNAT family acetyltransferase
VRVTRLDAAGFGEEAGAFLGAREAEHNLLLGLHGRLLVDLHAYGEDDPYFAVVEHEGRVVAAALRTPPHNLILSECNDDAACAALVSDVRDAFPDLAGVIGPVPAIGRFVATWRETTGDRVGLAMAQLVYAADEVLPLPQPAGRMRDVEERDHPLVRDWVDAFMREAVPDEDPVDAAEWVTRRLTDPDGALVVWDDGAAPVSFAASGSPTPHGIRVGPVYTPPGLRRRGFAAALVAELTRRLLEGGRDYCFLSTDRANPTSNAIYQRIGYRPVAEFELWRLERG